MSSEVLPLRILTVRQPRAWAIIHGEKDVENRVRNIAGAYRGPVAIHAARERDPYVWGRVEQLAGKRWPEEQDARGAIIGVVDLIDVHRHYSTRNGCLSDAGHARAEICSPWGESNTHHLVLANPRALNRPIPYKGALGLRTLDTETTARVLALVSGAKDGDAKPQEPMRDAGCVRESREDAELGEQLSVHATEAREDVGQATGDACHAPLCAGAAGSVRCASDGAVL